MDGMHSSSGGVVGQGFDRETVMTIQNLNTGKISTVDFGVSTSYRVLPTTTRFFVDGIERDILSGRSDAFRPKKELPVSIQDSLSSNQPSLSSRVSNKNNIRASSQGKKGMKKREVKVLSPAISKENDKKGTHSTVNKVAKFSHLDVFAHPPASLLNGTLIETEKEETNEKVETDLVPLRDISNRAKAHRFFQLEKDVYQIFYHAIGKSLIDCSEGKEVFHNILRYRNFDHKYREKYPKIKSIFCSTRFTNKLMKTKGCLTISTPIRYLPKEVGLLKSVEELDVSKTGISSLPKEMASMESLKCLDISNTDITSIPEEVLDLSNLEMIDLRNTPIAKDFYSLSVEKFVARYRKLASLAYKGVSLHFFTPLNRGEGMELKKGTILKTDNGICMASEDVRVEYCSERYGHTITKAAYREKIKAMKEAYPEYVMTFIDDSFLIVNKNPA